MISSYIDQDNDKPGRSEFADVANFSHFPPYYRSAVKTYED